MTIGKVNIEHFLFQMIYNSSKVIIFTKLTIIEEEFYFKHILYVKYMVKFDFLSIKILEFIILNLFNILKINENK